MIKLIQRFHSVEDVDFDLFHNTGTSSVKGRALRILPKDLVARGGLNYTQAYEQYYSRAAQEIHKAP
jgi:hypothetical protein